MTLSLKCQTCAVRLSALCTSIPEQAAAHLSRVTHRRRVPAGQTIYGGTAQSRSCAIIVKGVAKLTLAKPDGRTQIVGLQFPSHFIGHPFAGTPAHTVEAATDLDLCCFQGDRFETLVKQYPEVGPALLRRAFEDLDAAREWMFMIGRKSAEERVASLLLMMARHVTGGRSADPAINLGDVVDEVEFDLPLSRTEIAGCLGLRLETVSRQFAQLKEQGVIATGRRRRLRVHKLAALRNIAEQAAE